MKKIKLLLLLLMLGTASAYSQLQQIKIVSFTVKNQLPAVIDNWGNMPGSLLLVAQLPPNVSVKGIRLMVQIKSNGAIICGNNSTGGMQVDEFTTRSFSANELTSTLQGCRDLKEGSYSICVQFFNVDRVAISNDVCKEFSVETPREIEYTPPTLISPENGKVFTETELSRPVTFRWTPLVPKPREPVTYRLKVWQLMQGQSASQAMHSNQPIVTKDADNITQTVVNGILTGPCKPPYLCDFVWLVQALNREGKPIGKNEGNSDPYTFKVESNPAAYASPQLVSPTDGKTFAQNEMSAPVMFRWTPVVPKPQSVTYRLKVWQLMEGQNGTQAMRTNQPIIEKEVKDITQAAVTGIYTGPCKPPYLCDFVWQVQAVDREDHPIGNNEGKSELWSFKIGENGTTVCSPPKLSEPVDGRSFAAKDMSAPVLFRWTPVVPKPQTVTYRLKVWQLMAGQSATQAMRTNQPVVVKDVKDQTQTEISGIYTGPCKPPYLCDFVWEVQALNIPRCQPGEEPAETSTFKVEDKATTGTTECSPPKLSAPENGKKFQPEGTKGVRIKFSWGPVVPGLQEPVTYRLRVWQLMQGQSGTQAMRSNQPIVTKDVNNATEVDVDNIYTGPCKPPYLCDFIWEVQALTREGKQACTKNEGKSEAWSFKIQNNIDIQIDSLKVGCCEKGVQSIYIKVRNNLATPVKVVAIKYKVNGAGAAITFTPTSPTLPQTIAGNGFVVFTGFIECNPAINFLKFLVDAEDVADPDNKETEVKSDTLNCMCNVCKDIKIQPNEKDKPTVTSTAITQNISFVTGPEKVKSVKMDLVYFEFVPESDDCLVCTTPSSQMGNFSSGTLNNVGGIGGGTHGLSWNFSPPKDMNGGVPLQYNISYPKMVACCGAKAKWCIRYTVTYESCITCSVVVCYEASIKGCNK